jgi:hypothetical protein
MQRRSFLRSVALGGAAAAGARPGAGAPHPFPQKPIADRPAQAPSTPMKITRVRYYHNPKSPPHFNQSPTQSSSARR